MAGERAWDQCCLRVLFYLSLLTRSCLRHGIGAGGNGWSHGMLW